MVIRNFLAIFIICSIVFLPTLGLAQSGVEAEGINDLEQGFTVSDILDKISNLLNGLRDVVALGTGVVGALKSAWTEANNWMMVNLGTSINEVVYIFVEALRGLLDLFVSLFDRVLAV